MLIRCCLKDLFTLHKLAEKLSLTIKKQMTSLAVKKRTWILTGGSGEKGLDMNISLKSHEVLLTFPHLENASVTSGAGPFADQNHRFSYPFMF